MILLAYGRTLADYLTVIVDAQGANCTPRVPQRTARQALSAASLVFSRMPEFTASRRQTRMRAQFANEGIRRIISSPVVASDFIARKILRLVHEIG